MRRQELNAFRFNFVQLIWSWCGLRSPSSSRSTRAYLSTGYCICDPPIGFGTILCRGPGYMRSTACSTKFGNDARDHYITWSTDLDKPNTGPEWHYTIFKLLSSLYTPLHASLLKQINSAKMMHWCVTYGAAIAWQVIIMSARLTLEILTDRGNV